MGMVRGTRRRGGRGVVALLGVVVFAALMLGVVVAPHAEASSGAGLSFTPTSGPTGTMVTVTINPMPDSVGQSYTLEAGMGDSDMDACNGFNPQPIRGVAPVVLHQNGTTTTFAWPTSLNQGPYWICAGPTPGTTSGGIAYDSTQPFTVSNAVTPTATPRTTARSVVASVPAGGVLTGSTFTLTVTGWSSPVGTPPQIVTMTVVGPSQATPEAAGNPPLGTSAQFTLASGPGTGDYVLTVTVPTTLVPGTWWAIVADQRGQVYSNAFTVIVPPTATTPPLRTASGPTGTSNTSSGTGTSPSLLVVGILLAIIVAMLAAFLLRRRARLQRHARQLQERQLQERQMRVQQYPQPQRQDKRQEQWARQAPPRDPRYPRQ